MIMNSNKIKSTLMLPTLYIYNYHAINIVVCILFLGLQAIGRDDYFEAVSFIHYFIKYSVILMIVLNSVFLIKSILVKTYTSINETQNDIYQMISFMVMLCFKVCIMVLIFFIWLGVFEKNYMNITVHIVIGCFFAMYCISYLLFLYFSLIGIKNRIKHVKVNNHWTFEFMNEKQIRNVKTYQEEGKVIGIYFKGFIVNEKENELILNNKSLNLNSFKFYMNSKQCKLDDLTDDDIAIMEMLSI